MKLSDVRFIADRLREMSPALVEELKTILRNPRELSVLLESRSPWLSRKLLGMASNVAEPFLVGSGLSVERLDEELVEARLPGWWRNQGEAGALHSGALVALGEFASRLYWEHHLDLRSSELSVRRVQLRILARANGEVRGVYRMSVTDREAILLGLRRDGAVDFETEVSIFDGQGRIVAQVDVEWRIEKHLALGTGSRTHT